jgi:hypothetical protein
VNPRDLLILIFNERTASLRVRVRQLIAKTPNFERRDAGTNRARPPLAFYTLRKGRLKIHPLHWGQTTLSPRKRFGGKSRGCCTTEDVQTVDDMDARLRARVNYEGNDWRVNEEQSLVIESSVGTERVLKQLPIKELHMPTPAELVA